MGRFSTSGARLHEPRRPKPANAAFRQGRPPQSHGFSSASNIPNSPSEQPAGKPALGRYRAGPMPPAQRWLDPPRRPRGALPASSPLGPHRPHARSSAAGLSPGTHRCAPHARHSHRIPGDIGPLPAIRWGCRPSRAFANPALRTASRAYRPTSRARGLASAADRWNPGKIPAALQSPAEALRRKQDSRRQIAASMPHARDRTCPKGPENGIRAGSCADASAQSAMRHRRRRKKGGGDVREPQEDDVAQAGRC